ncbi:MAG: hypothetical protein RLY76_903 [Actinomycetota bacterium]
MSRFLFTSRAGGVSNAPYESLNLANHVGDSFESVDENRLILANLLGYQRSQLFFMNQVHGNKVVIVDKNSDSEFTPDADALFTTQRDMALVTLVADCIPLLLESSNAVAAVHVGRKGLVLNILQETLRVFQEHGIKSNEVKAHVGPSICAKCYEVGKDVYRDVVALVPAAASQFRSLSDKPCLDIEAGLISQLDSQGVIWEKVGKCTMHDDGYFSYRRDGVTGRQAGVITLNEGRASGS